MQRGAEALPFRISVLVLMALATFALSFSVPGTAAEKPPLAKSCRTLHVRDLAGYGLLQHPSTFSSPAAPGDAAPSTDARSASAGHLVQTMTNPAAVYCTELGYRYDIADGTSGQVGICVFDNHSSCPAWDFLTGACGQEFSVCAREGLQTEIAQDGQDPFSENYAVCVDADGRAQSVAEIAHLLDRSGGKAIEPAQGQPETKGSPTSDAATLDTFLPSAFDWRNVDGGNWMTPIRDQGICGSCWAFAAVGVAESALNIAAQNPSFDPDLAEQYLISGCSGVGACAGGSLGRALEYIRDAGIPDEACFPYRDGLPSGCSYSYLGVCRADLCTYSANKECSDYRCTARCSDWAVRLQAIDATDRVGYNPPKSVIKQALLEHGPLAGSMTMDGYFDPSTHVFRCGDNESSSHAVVIVGYDDAGGYWIVRNSWGTGFGPFRDGYFWVKYDDCTLQKYLYYGSASVVAMVANDDIANAQEITATPFTVDADTSGATSGVDDPAFSLCGGETGSATVWYRLTPGASGLFEINTEGSNYDTLLGVWTGTPGNLTAIACDDDGGEGSTSVTTALLQAGSTYYVEVAGGTGSTGGLLHLAVHYRVRGDQDGEGRSDLVVFRPSNGAWFALQSSTGYSTWLGKSWGADGDLPLGGDLDGDGQMDLIVYRPEYGVWFALTSASEYDYVSYFVRGWGAVGDTPISGDLDGDGRMDLIVYRPSVSAWFALKSSAGYDAGSPFARAWGSTGDIPVSGDIDGDGKMDLIVYRPSVGTWFALTSSNGYDSRSYFVKAYGRAEDIPISGDIDGDSKMDLVLYRPSVSVWFSLNSSSNYTASFAKAWGAPGDLPVSGDLDGDGKMDLIVYRPAYGVWFGLTSSSGYDITDYFVKGWGTNGDLAVR